MDEPKKIDIQQHVSPKVPRKYLWKVLFYCLLLGGLVLFILYLRNDQEPKQAQPAKPNVEEVQEINDFTIED